MAKKVVVEFDEDGGMTVEFDGYVGRECFVDAAKIRALLLKMGVVVKGEVVRPKRAEVIVDGITMTEGGA